MYCSQKPSNALHSCTSPLHLSAQTILLLYTFMTPSNHLVQTPSIAPLLSTSYLYTLVVYSFSLIRLSLCKPVNTFSIHSNSKLFSHTISALHFFFIPLSVLVTPHTLSRHFITLTSSLYLSPSLDLEFQLYMSPLTSTLIHTTPSSLSNLEFPRNTFFFTGQLFLISNSNG